MTRYSLAEAVRAIVGQVGWNRLHLEVLRQQPMADHLGPLARSTDPDSSQDGAKKQKDIRRFGRGTLAHQTLLLYVNGAELTDQEAGDLLCRHLHDPKEIGERHATVRRRAAEMTAAHFTYLTGERRGPKGPRVKKITEAGERALLRVEESGWSL